MSKFKVGQRVRIVVDSYGWSWTKNSVGVVTSVLEEGSIRYTVAIDSKFRPLHASLPISTEYYFLESSLVPEGELSGALYD